MKRTLIKSVGYRISYVVAATLTALLLVHGTPGFAQSFSQDDVNSIIGETPFYDPNGTACSAVTAGAGSPDGATFPDLDPTAMANAINTYITQYNSKSEMAGLGATIVASAKNSNVSPFIIVAIAQKESGLASPSDANVINANNSFGRTAGPGQPSWQGARAWYKWSSVKASVDYTAPENQSAVGGGDEAAYIRAEYATALDTDNLLSFFEVYNPVSDGGNPPSYAALVQSIINTVAGQAGAPASGSAVSSTSDCGTSGSVSCNTSASTSGLSTVRQNVVCIAQQELAIWKAQPGYPWDGPNSYSETGYLKYSQNRQEEWCADFATWVYNQAQYPLRPDPDWNVSYVPNIQAIGQKEQNFHWHPEDSYTPKPGDMAIHGSDHVNIVISVSGSTITLIGGDQGNGPYPGGSIVSTEVISSIHADGITGYVSPD